MAIRFLDEPQPAQTSTIKYLDEPKGLGDRLIEDLSKRGGNIAEAYRATDFGFSGQPEQGKQSELEFLAQTAGQGFGAAGDILGNLALSGYRQFAPQSTQEAVGRGIESFAQSGTGQALGNVIGQYQQWAEQNPRAARNLGALGNIASVFPWGRATTTAGKGLQEAANVFKSKVDDVIKNAVKMDSSTLRQNSSFLYKEAANMGGAYKPKVTQDLIREAETKYLTQTPVMEKFSEGLKRGTGDEYVQDVIDAFRGIQDKTIGISDFDAIDKQITDLILSNPEKKLQNEFGELLPAGKKIKDIQLMLRNKGLEAAESDVIGGSDGFKALSGARKLWAQNLKAREVEERLGRALNTQQPNAALKKTFGDLVLEMEEIKGKGGFNWTDAEIAAAKKVAESGKLDEVLNLFGSRLGSSIMAGTGNPITAVAMRELAKLPRGLATNAQVKRTQDLLNIIGGVQPESTTKNIIRGATRQGLNAPANVLGTAGTGLRYRAPQFTALGLLQNAPEDLQQ